MVDDFAIQRVSSIAVLRSIPVSTTRSVHLLSYYGDNNGGGGDFYALTGAAPGTYTDDGGITIVPTGGDGSSAWRREVYESVSVKHFGAKGDGVADDWAAITAAIEYVNSAGGGNVMVPVGTFNISATVYVLQDVHLQGTQEGSKIDCQNIVGAGIYVGNSGGTLQYRAKVTELNVRGSCTTAVQVYNSIDSEVSSINLVGLTGAINGFVFEWTWNSAFHNLRTNGAAISTNCFVVGGAYNANTASQWATSNFCDCNFLIDSTYGTHGFLAGGNVWSGLTAQGGDIGVWFRSHIGGKILGYYEENTTLPVMFGDAASAVNAIDCCVDGGIMNGPNSSHPNWANRIGFVHFDNAQGCSVACVDMLAIRTRFVSFTGGGGSGAIAIARLTTTDAVHSYEIIYGGTGYATPPTAVIAGTGSGEVPTVGVSGGAVTTLTKGTGGSGYTETLGCPVGIAYKQARRCAVIKCNWSGLDYPFYQNMVRLSGAWSYGSVTIEHDHSLKGSLTGAPATIKKSRGANLYMIEEIDAAGALVTTSYSPPQYP